MSDTPLQYPGFVAQSVENTQPETEGMQNFQQIPQYDAFQHYGAAPPDSQGFHNAMATPAEPEPQGTGIKEDG